MNLSRIIDTKKASLDKNQIWITKHSHIQINSQTKLVWEKIFNFSEREFLNDRREFRKSKLKDHVSHIESSYKFTDKTVYLEIGCGPSYIGEYLMKKYNVTFIGVDFNYSVLLQLGKYFKLKKLKKYHLVHADLLKMPIKKSSIDYIYGGGTIEHLRNTSTVLKRLYLVLKKGGVCFNTVPAFNLWWLTRFYNNIPATHFLKSIFEMVHLKLLNYSVLNKYYGYELSYTENQLLELHKKNGFQKIMTGAFSFHASPNRLTNPLLKKVYFELSRHPITSPVYYVYATK